MVKKKKNKVFATWYNSKAKPTKEYSFLEIWEEAAMISHGLRVHHQLNKGDRVILCYSFGLQFFAAFLGCLRAGVVAVLIYPPSPKNLSKALSKMTKIVEDSNAKLVLVDETVNLLRVNPLSKSRSLWPQNATFSVHPKSVKTSLKKQEVFNKMIDKDPIKSTDLAFLQYTSVSTGDPKGVMVTFKALNANVQSIISSIEFEASSASIENIVGMSWLPQYHDMGLIVAIVAPFAGGWNCNMISPFEFIKNPLLWIDLMSRLRVGVP